MDFILDNTEQINLLTDVINQMFDENYDCYIVGSSMIKNYEYKDVDILVCYDEAINITEKRITTFVFNKLLKNKTLPFSLIRIFKANNNNIENLPHYNIRTQSQYIVDANLLTEEELNNIRNMQLASIENKHVFTAATIQNKNTTTRTEFLQNLVEKKPNRLIIKTPCELALQDWKYLDYSKRIIAPLSLLLELSNFEVWWRINGLPFEKRGDFVYCYCNEIDPQHTDLFNSLLSQGIIQLENIPLSD